MVRIKCRIVVTALAAWLGFASASHGAEWAVPEVRLPGAAKHPMIACTAEELARLKAAHAGSGPAHAAVAAVVAEAEAALARPLVFPPRGGQHNQWYQCETCQIGLKTLDDTHHQCPRCQKIYTGAPFDDVIFARVHSANLRGAHAAAWAYALTGKPAYARHAAQVLLGYAQRYRAYPLHDAACKSGALASRSAGHVAEQTLNEAEMMADLIAPAFDLIHDWDGLAEADRAAIRAGLLVPMLQNIDRNQAGKSNWQTWHNAAFVWGGAVLGDAAWVRKALADPANGFAYQMTASVTAEGMWYENSWGYHFYTLDAMVLLAEGSRRLGIDLWSHPGLRKMVTLPLRYTMADGSLPRFGDDVQTTLRGGRAMEAAFHACADPGIGGLLPNRPTWDSVLLGRRIEPLPRPAALGSEVFPGAGHAILRTQGPAGLTAALTFGPYGGFHGHFDKLSFVFFGYGQELGVDPGRAASQAYRLPIHMHWYKATLGHNTVLVDAASQAPASGTLELFAATDQYAAVVAQCDAGYPGVKHRRLLFLSPSYLLVLDELSSDSPHRYDWLYHNRGSAVRCPAASQPAKLGDAYPGQEYVENIKLGATDQTTRVEFVGHDLVTYLTVAAEAGTEVRIGDGVGKSVVERVPLVTITRQGRAVRFAAVLEPVAAGGRPGVTDVAVAPVREGLRVVVRAGDAADAVTLTATGQLRVTRDGQVVLAGAPAP